MMARAIQLMMTDYAWDWHVILCADGRDSSLPTKITAPDHKGRQTNFLIAGTVAGVPVYKEI